MLRRFERVTHGSTLLTAFAVARRPIGRLTTLVSLGVAVGACSTSPRGQEPVAQTEQAIEGGDPINDGYNKVLAPWFPVFAVGVGSPDGSGGFTGYCTGTIIAPTLVLTAAHCQVTAGSDAVILYPVGAGKGNLPSGTTDLITNVAVQTGVVCNGSTTGWPDSSCWSTWGSGTSHYADLKVLTLATALADPYQPIGIRPSASSLSSWFSDIYAVGRGYVNFTSVDCNAAGMPPAVANGNFPGTPGPSAMFWKPAPTGFFPGGNSTDDQWTTSSLVAVPGDSGGPLLRFPPLGQFVGIIGVLSSYSGCSTFWGHNTYTSVVQTDNYNWLQSLGAVMKSNIIIPGLSPVDPVESFGAAQ